MGDVHPDVNMCLDGGRVPQRAWGPGCYNVQRQSSERYGSHFKHRCSEHPAHCSSSAPQSSQGLWDFACVADHPVLAGVAHFVCLPTACGCAIVIPPSWSQDEDCRPHQWMGSGIVGGADSVACYFSSWSDGDSPRSLSDTRTRRLARCSSAATCGVPRGSLFDWPVTWDTPYGLPSTNFKGSV